MQQKIQRLSETVINQIAAGEVVENPASIVKELIENSLDAGARRIEVEITAGGQQLIRVEDDGSGMSREDALLSLERHATSKIRSVEDLSSLATMGFRGEALAAIASVSQFELKTADGKEGTRIYGESGKVETIEPCARNRGTTIEVRSLFFNVPARKKFQKSPSANGSQVSRLIETLSLAHPEVAFTLISNGKKTISVESSSSKERMEKIIGPHPHEISYSRLRISVQGFAGSPDQAKANRSGQYLFINRRPVFSPLISRAVKDAFATRIGENAHPSFVLFLEIPPDAVDVNVHPQKKEVRFRDEGMIYRLVQEAVSSVFSPAVSFPEAVFFREPPPFSFPQIDRDPFPEQSYSLNDSPRLDFIYPEKVLAVFGPYLLLLKEDLILADLRAIQARILFESLEFQKGDRQPLIWPLEIELANGEEGMAEELNRMGIECRLIGRKTLAVDALPSLLEAAQFPQFFAAWKEGKKLPLASTRFCRGLKRSYSLQEAEMLWRQLQKCKDCLYDPTGHPIWTHVKESDLEKLLGKKS